MGFWDSLLGEEKKIEKTTGGKGSMNPFQVALSFSPLRLSANRRNSVHLVVKIKNVSSDTQLVSVDALLPKDAMLGFDQACINKATEKRAGELKGGETMEVPVELWANNQTKEGNYPIAVTVYSHYIGYDKVLSYIKKSISLRVV